MTFWNFFFNYKKIIENNSKTVKNVENLCIENLEQNDKQYNIYFSLDKKINLNELEKLCDAVGWVRRPLKKVKLAIEQSFLIASLFYYDDDEKKLIGFARATSDNSFNATIWDVVIHPDFQGKGIGKELMNKLIKQLRKYDINTITLFADPEVIKFYRQIGFVIDPDGVKGMFWYPI
uniref:N-acetyltransferase domain-containing protein n=1 Tax=Ophidocladus simpliciusculus TaxID=1261574 RepID=A0A1Z1MIK8_9FLOR|nr:hypothetical protein [Ophidocladus simpliciusculus]ARW65898.1 hypothetical protein [Ophidocladus simpliciusculus]